MQINTLITQMLILFILMLVGYAAVKLKVLSSENTSVISKLLLNISLPCTVLNSVLGEGVEVTGMQALIFTALSFAAYGILLLLCLPVPKLLAVPREDAGIYRFMTVFANVGFMGYPVAEAMFGATAVFYAALYNIAFNLLAYSLGVSMISGQNGGINWKKVINAPIVATFISIIIYVLNVKLPHVIVSPIQYLAGTTTPLAMMVVGATLASIPLRDIFSGWRVYALSFLSLIVVPVITWLIFRWFVTDTLMLQVLVLLAAMPGASICTVLSLQYGGNAPLSSKILFWTTFLSVFTVPLITWLLF